MSGSPNNSRPTPASPERRARWLLFGLTTLAALLLLWRFSGNVSSVPRTVFATAVCSGPGSEYVAERMVSDLKTSETLLAVLQRTVGAPIDDSLLAEFQRHLVIQAGSAGLDRHRVTVEYGGAAVDAAAVVNNLVQHGVANNVDAADPAAHAAVEAAEADLKAATERAKTARAELDAFLDEHYAELQTVPAAIEPKTTTTTQMVPNPDWNAAQKELDWQRAYRTDLVTKMTADHPRVRELDLKIALTTDRLAGIPRLIEQQVEKKIKVDEQAVRRQQQRRNELQAEYTRLEQQHQRREEEVTTQLETLHQFETNAVGLTCETWVSTWADPPPAQHLRLGVLGVVALLCGGGAAAKGVRPNPAMTSLPEVSATLDIPIAGVITSNQPAPRRRAKLNRFGLLLATASVVVLVSFGTWSLLT